MNQYCYLIELGGDKEINEMDALELTSYKDALTWIQSSIESDAEYYDINVVVSIHTIKYVEYSSSMDFYALTFVYCECDKKDVVEDNLDVISKIVKELK